MVPWKGHIKRYHFSAIDVSTTTATRTIKGPLDKAGRLWDYGAQCATTAFAGGTTTPMIEVGKSGTLAAYGVAYDLLTLAVAAGSKSPRIDLHTDDATWHSAAFVDADIPKNTIVYVTMLAASGAGQAGVGDFFVEILWQD